MSPAAQQVLHTSNPPSKNYINAGNNQFELRVRQPARSLHEQLLVKSDDSRHVCNRVLGQSGEFCFPQCEQETSMRRYPRFGFFMGSPNVVRPTFFPVEGSIGATGKSGSSSHNPARSSPRVRDRSFSRMDGNYCAPAIVALQEMMTAFDTNHLEACWLESCDYSFSGDS